MIQRAVAAAIGATVRIWSGGRDLLWEGDTYKPGILLSDDVAAGAALTPGSSPGLDVYLANVPGLLDDVRSGDDVDVHVLQRSSASAAWMKVGGIWAIVDEVEGPAHRPRITTLPPLERAAKTARRRWSREDWLSRYPDDDIFRNLERLRTEGQTIEFP